MRLRAGEIAAGLAAVSLFALLFMDWTDDRATGWESLWLGTALAVAAVLLLGAGLPLALLTKQTVAAQVVTTVLCVWAGLIAVVALAINNANLARDDALIGPVSLRWPAYAAIAAAALLTWGAWHSMRDERTEGDDDDLPEPRALPDD